MASPGTANVSVKKVGSGSTGGRLVSLRDEETQASIRELTQIRKAATDLETKQREMNLATEVLTIEWQNSIVLPPFDQIIL